MTELENLEHHIDRAAGRRDQQGVTFYGARNLLQGGELNEMQTIARERARRTSNLIASNGNRIRDCSALVNVDAQTVTLSAGEIYINGDVMLIEAATLNAVPMVGALQIGVRLVTSYITHEDDPTLVGQVPGSDAEGEGGAARELATISWALAGDGAPGDFTPVYLLQDGTILDQTPPPNLDGVANAIAVSDHDANGNYMVEGCRVTALGKTGNDQIFSIEQGVARVRGQRITRQAALRVSQTEDWDVIAVPGETHLFGAGASTTITTDFSPIAEITSILLTKQRTITVTRGGTGAGADGLQDPSVTEILDVSQGGATYVEGVDFNLVGNNCDWAPPGAEPTGGSSYNVTYLYNAAVNADGFTDTEITISDGVDGKPIYTSYTWKVPRIDLICLNQYGQPVYLEGVSAQSNLLAPLAPSDLLKLAEVHNDWMGKPTIKNNGDYAMTMAAHNRMARAQENLLRLMMIERASSALDRRENTAHKNMFVDQLIDDAQRDAGEPQTAAVFGGMMQLEITPTFYDTGLVAPVMLDFVEETIISQELSTNCLKINLYQNFTPLPGALSLVPQADFWVEQVTEWVSPVTQEFNRGVRFDGGPLAATTQAVNTLDTRSEQAEFLRQIDLSALIEGLADGENLAVLTFDGIDVKPAGVQTADETGTIELTFTIPEGVTAGSKLVYAESAGGIVAQTVFTGEGTINTTVMQRINTINRWTAGRVDLNEFNVNGDDGGAWGDPQAQTFTPPETRQLIGVDFKLCAIGDATNNILVHQVTVENGTPTTDLVAEAFLPMNDVVEGWVSPRYGFPVLTPNDREHAFVIKTDDGDHSISTAELGAFDEISQTYIAEHPYLIGTRHDGNNARSWLAHPESAITFRVIAAKYTETQKIVDLGSHDLVDCSDLQVRAETLLPSGDCSVVFEVVRADSSVLRMQPYQVVQFNEYVTETVQLRAVLTGTEKLSPILFAPVQVMAGKIAETGTYVSRAFDLGNPARLTAYFKAFMPAGATVGVKYDLADDNFVELPNVATDALAFPNWSEPKHEIAGITATQGRLKLTLTGGPAARPVVGDLGAAVY